MPKPRKKERIVCPFFVWNLGQRNGVFFADGRSNKPSLGRHSLETRNREEALSSLRELDEVMAVRHGKVKQEHLPNAASATSLELNEGWSLYRAHVSRPRIAGGAKPTTAKRYRAIFEKIIRFAGSQGISLWNHVDRHTLEKYAAWLDAEDYAYRTQYIELSTLKQAVKWFVAEELLPTRSLISFPMKKASGSDTYCWTREQVQAMRERCQADKNLIWLDRVIVALACTGLRISELASLRWSDIDTSSQSDHADRRESECQETEAPASRDQE
ncbi:MAG: tyrosine-type recombinase/integrase [Planctomycetales bacterium]|jgi:hypothetical protein